MYQIEDLHFSYRRENGERDKVLQGLNLTLEAGEVFVVISPGGAGKTTLLKVMAGLLQPISGTVKFQGQDLFRIPLHDRYKIQRRIGMTFERGGLFDSLNVEENLTFPLKEWNDLDPEQLAGRVDQALSEVGLARTQKKRTHELSGGMRKRLGIARALILNPEVVLYDDPTAGLDPITARAIINLLRMMKLHFKMTAVIVTSDLTLAFQLADRIGFLYQGIFLQIGKLVDIQQSENPVVKQFVGGLLEGPLTRE